MSEAMELELAPPSERRVRFTKLVKKRMDVALKRMSMIRPLANRGAYEYTEADVDAICKAFEAEVVRIRQAFARPDREPPEFDIPA
jgi:hypothetical protein